MAITRKQFCSIGTGSSMYCQSLTGRYKSKHVIPGNRFAAIGEIVHDLIAAFSKDDQLCIPLRYYLVMWNDLVLQLLLRLHRFWRFDLISNHFEFFQLFEID